MKLIHKYTIMLKPSELQIGDYARVNRDGLCIKKGTIVTIRGIDADNRLNSDIVGSATCRPLDDEQLQGGIWCEFLDPIQITAEILEKNWFTPCIWNGKDGWSITYPIRNGVKVCVSSDFFHFGYFGHDSKIPLFFVHQLQHALRLCGIEKEIKL